METVTWLGSGKRFGKMEESQPSHLRRGVYPGTAPSPGTRKAQALGEPGCGGSEEEAED